MRRTGDEHGGQRLGRRVGVVGEHACGVHRQRRVLVRRVGVGAGYRRAGKRHRQDHVGAGAQVVAGVTGAVDEAVRTGVAAGRGVGEAPVRVQRQRAVRRVGREDRRQRIAVRIGVVGQDARSRDDERDVPVRRVAVGGGDRRVHDGAASRTEQRRIAGARDAVVAQRDRARCAAVDGYHQVEIDGGAGGEVGKVAGDHAARMRAGRVGHRGERRLRRDGHADDRAGQRARAAVGDVHVVGQGSVRHRARGRRGDDRSAGDAGTEGIDVDVAAVAAEGARRRNHFQLQGVADVDDARAARRVDSLPAGVAEGAGRRPGHARLVGEREALPHHRALRDVADDDVEVGLLRLRSARRPRGSAGRRSARAPCRPTGRCRRRRRPTVAAASWRPGWGRCRRRASSSLAPRTRRSAGTAPRRRWDRSATAVWPPGRPRWCDRVAAGVADDVRAAERLRAAQAEDCGSWTSPIRRRSRRPRSRRS